MTDLGTDWIISKSKTGEGHSSERIMIFHETWTDSPEDRGYLFVIRVRRFGLRTGSFARVGRGHDKFRHQEVGFDFSRTIRKLPERARGRGRGGAWANAAVAQFIQFPGSLNKCVVEEEEGGGSREKSRRENLEKQRRSRPGRGGGGIKDGRRNRHKKKARNFGLISRVSRIIY